MRFSTMQDADNKNSHIVDLQNILDKNNIEYKIIIHRYNIATVEDARELFPDDIDKLAPTLILKADGNYLAAIVSGETRISIKKIKKQLLLKNVSFADPQTVKQLSGSELGQVSLVNPALKTIIDLRVLENDVVYGGCGVEKHTLKIKPEDLVRINHALVFDFSEEKNN